MGIRPTWLAMLLALAGLARAETWFVDAAAPCPGQGTAAAPFCAIQSALDAAQDGDLVEVAPGTYLENVDFRGKQVRLVATGGPGVTVLDGQQLGSCVTFRSGEGPGAQVIGLTLTNGSAPAGGGVSIENASPTLRDNAVLANRAFDGAGIAVLGGAPIIERNRIEDNWAITGSGGGLYLRGDAVVRGNAILRNRASGFSGGGGIACREAGAATIERNRIEDNQAAVGAGVLLDRCQGALVSNRLAGNTAELDGGGVYLVDTDARVVLNVLHGNVAVRGGGVACGLRCRSILAGNLVVRNGDPAITTQGGAIHCAPDATPLLLNGTLFGNTAQSGGGIWTSGTLMVVNSILWGNAGGEIVPVGGQLSVGTSIVAGGWPGPKNLSSDPRFLDPTRDDFRLACDSPALEAGAVNALLPPVDLDGDPRLVDADSNGTATVDIGADELAFLWEPLGPLSAGSLIAFRAQAPLADHGRVALVFLSLGDGTRSGGIPLPGGAILALDPDALFLLTFGLPLPARSVILAKCPGAVTQPVPIPASAPPGLTVHYAGVLLGPGGSIVDTSPTESFELR